MALSGSAVALGLVGTMVGLVVGAISGRMTAPSVEPLSVPTAVSVPVASARSRPISIASSPIATMDETRWRAQLCEAELRSVRAARTLVDPGWPTDLGPEDPGEWGAILDEVIAECGLPVSVEEVDCGAYPCVARVQTHPEAGDGGDADAWRECPALERLMPGAEFHIADTFVACPDGSLKPVEVAFLHRQDTLDDLLAPYVSGDWDEFEEVTRVLARRYDAAASTAECD